MSAKRKSAEAVDGDATPTKKKKILQRNSIMKFGRL
jgi:hypothetical protein